MTAIRAYLRKCNKLRMQLAVAHGKHVLFVPGASTRQRNPGHGRHLVARVVTAMSNFTPAANWSAHAAIMCEAAGRISSTRVLCALGPSQCSATLGRGFLQTRGGFTSGAGILALL